MSSPKKRSRELPTLPKVVVPEGMRFLGWVCQTDTKGSNPHYHVEAWRRDQITARPGFHLGDGEWCPDCFPVFAGKPGGRDTERERNDRD